MKETPAKSVLASRAVLGEGDCWIAQEERLYRVDILRCEVHRFDPVTGRDEMRLAPSQVTLVQPTTRGDLVLGTLEGIARMNFDTGILTPLCDPEKNLSGNRFNDGKPDPAGRLFLGSMAYERTAKTANLWRIEPDLSFSKIIGLAGNSNGLGWSPDEKTFYWTDTRAGCVFAFDYDRASGDICNRRVALEVDQAVGRPDGLTVDAEGFLWTALWGGFGVARWNPANGELVEKVTCPAPYVTCPSFGGPSLDVLYFTTAQKGSAEMKAATEAEAGNIFAAQPGVQGLPGFAFAG